jgi:hypothetical protein
VLTESQAEEAPRRIAQFADRLYEALVVEKFGHQTSAELLKAAMPEIVKAVTR